MLESKVDNLTVKNKVPLYSDRVDSETVHSSTEDDRSVQC